MPEELMLELDLRVGWHLYAHREGSFAQLSLTPSRGCGYQLGDLALPGDERRRSGKKRSRLGSRAGIRLPFGQPMKLGECW